MTAPAPPRLEVRLRSPQALQDAMYFARLNVRELAAACGKQSYRSTIGHLRSGHRNRCSPHLAARIEHVLRLPPHSLFDLSMPSTHHVDTSYQKARKVA